MKRTNATPPAPIFIATMTGTGFYKVINRATGKTASLKGLRQTNIGTRGRAEEVAKLLNDRRR